MIEFHAKYTDISVTVLVLKFPSTLQFRNIAKIKMFVHSATKPKSDECVYSLTEYVGSCILDSALR
jgi:hypothetical protein